jgi:hypothetical protein
LREAQVEEVVPDGGVLGAHVQGDRQAAGGVDPGACRVERELPDGNAHPVGPQVAQPQDPLAVGHHDDRHVLLRPVSQDLHHPSPVRRGDVEPPGAAEDVGELLARLAHGGGVDDGQHLLDVVDHRAVEQGAVPVLQAHEEDVLVEICALAMEVGEDPPGLLLLGKHPRRQETSNV